MSTYGIKPTYQHNAEIHPVALNLCVSSFLLMLRNGLVATRAPEGGEGGSCLYPTKHVRLADTGYGYAALGGTRVVPESQQTLATFDQLMTSYSILADNNDNIKIAILISYLAPFISLSADL